MAFYQDIPRICTALAEWGACTMYLFLLKKEEEKSFMLFAGSFAVLALQGIFLMFTGNLPIVFWLPCMMGAILIMFIYLLFGAELSAWEGVYCTAKAFLLAEFAASLEWQIFSFFQIRGWKCAGLQWILVLVIYGLCFYMAFRLEEKSLSEGYLKQLTKREAAAVVLVALISFAFSNLSFIYQKLPFTSSHRADIFTIRTLIDFGGMVILHAYQSRISEYMVQNELTAIQAVLKNQYAQYRNYQDSMELLSIKYHDLKHQIEGLRGESDETKRKKWLDVMEEEVRVFETMNQTGNQVLDTILAAKVFRARKQKIQITCVADGKLLDFMHVTDICSLFGNALDNAVECVALIPEEEKRLIHVEVSAKKNFVFIRVENYCENTTLEQNGTFPATTKADKNNHGFGLKSIYAVAEKYGGCAEFSRKNDWFELNVLIPRE